MKKKKCLFFRHVFAIHKIAPYEGVLYRVEECLNCPKRRVKKA